jgi:hypothetical protein
MMSLEGLELPMPLSARPRKHSPLSKVRDYLGLCRVHWGCGCPPASRLALAPSPQTPLRQLPHHTPVSQGGSEEDKALGANSSLFIFNASQKPRFGLNPTIRHKS